MEKDPGRGGVWRNRLIGNYNWKFLCMPTPPWNHDRPLPPFYGKDEKLSLLVAIVMGAQHALAMVGGIITAPLLIASAGFQPENETCTSSTKPLQCKPRVEF
jgi:hypothetical protein